MSFWRVLLFITLLVPTFLVAGENLFKGEKGKALFDDIVKTTEILLRFCPPEDCVIVGMGRSPTPIMAYLSGKGIDARTLPINSLGVKRLVEGDDYVRAYLNDFIKTTLESAPHKKIMVLDYAFQGYSIEQVGHYFQSYLKQHHIDREVETCALTLKSNPYLKEFPRVANHIMRRDGPLIEMLSLQQFDDYSEFLSYFPEEESSPVSNKKGWESLKKMFIKVENQKSSGCIKSFFNFLISGVKI